MKKNFFFLIRKKIPLFILGIWTTAIGFFIWQRVNQSESPPLYDPLTYYEKAKNFWKNAHLGFPQNPLNVEPVVRPPGTVLLSYPFGFQDDYHGYLFRSVFMPFLIWIITILILVWPKREQYKEKSYWSTVIAVMLLGPLPFFFQFDYGISAHWGLVDSFLASMSALSLALGIKSIEKKSKSLLICSVLASSICPFIKPVGCFIFLLIALCWSTMCLFVVLNKNNQEKKSSIKFGWLGSILFFLTGIVIIYLARTSAYLGQNTVHFFSQATNVLNNESKEYTTIPVFLSLFYSAVGPQFLLYTSLFIFVLTRYGKRIDCQIPFGVLFFSSFIFIVLGIWFWVWMTGISQIRYFYPFLLLGYVPLLYGAHNILRWQTLSSNVTFHKIIKLTGILPAVNILFLLSVLNPNNTWQKNCGLSLNIRVNDPGVKMAKQFLTSITKEKVTSTVYDMNMSPSNNSFASYGILDHLIHPEMMGFNCIHPVDWARPSTFRFKEIILNSNYIIFRPMRKEEQVAALSDSIIDSFGEEQQAIEAFLNALTPSRGLQTIFAGEDCTLSKITDKNNLIQAIEPFLYSRQWRPLFEKENKITKGGWKLFQIPYEGIPRGYIKDISNKYAGFIESVNGQISSTDTIETNDDIILEGWLAYDTEKGIKADDVFVVITYPDGTLLYWPTSLRSRPDLSETYHQPALIDAGFTSFIDVSRQKGIYTAMMVLGYKNKLIHCETIKRTIRKL